MEWINKTQGAYSLEVTKDLVCFVSWQLMKRDMVKRKKFDRGIHQLLRPSQNQYKWQGHVRGDESNKHFYSDNIELLQRLVLNHAKQIIKGRIREYQKVLQNI